MAHSHGGGGCCHSHDDTSSGDLGTSYSLYKNIDLDNVSCLNEVTEGSGRSVFKPFENRLDRSKYVESDCDPELLFNIPFTGNVKLKGLIIMGGEEGSHPSAIKIYKNRGHMSFDDTSGEADQEFQLTRDNNGTVEYPLKVVKFSSVYNLALYFPRNFGEESTKIYYIGLRGEFQAAQRDAIVLTSYELAPNPCDHKTKAMDSVANHVH